MMKTDFKDQLELAVVKHRGHHRRACEFKNTKGIDRKTGCMTMSKTPSIPSAKLKRTPFAPPRTHPDCEFVLSPSPCAPLMLFLFIWTQRPPYSQGSLSLPLLRQPVVAQRAGEGMVWKEKVVFMIEKGGAVLGSIGPIAYKGAEEHRRNDVAEVVILGLWKEKSALPGIENRA